MFEASYQMLLANCPDFGRISTLPWDEKIFGFPVADYQSGDARVIAGAKREFSKTLEAWADVNRVELVGASVPAEDVLWCTLLPILGFTFVDYTIKISQPRLQAWTPPPTKGAVRLAEPADEAGVEYIAQHAFRAGRYHRDGRFPRALSDLRYKQWMTNAFTSLGQGSRLYLTGEVGHATGFFHVNLDGEYAYITIIAVAPDKQGGRTGLDLAAGALADLKAIGIRKMNSKISAMNSGVMNLAVFLGWRLADAHAVFHWHAPDAPHLVKEEDVFL